MDEKQRREKIMMSIDHRIMDAFINAGKYHRAMLEKRLQDTGVFRGQHHVLMCISDHENISQKELARIMNVSTAAIAVSLKKLEKGGYIGRAVDSNDNRYNNIRITEKGSEVVCQSVDIFQKAEEQTFAGFTEEEKVLFLDFLIRAGENIKNASKTESEGKEDEAL